MEQQITKDFTVVHARVHYPDGTGENIEYVDGFVHDGVFETYDIEKDDWSASVKPYSGEAYLHYNAGPDNRIIYPNENYKKIEAKWVEELTAVATVEIEVERRGLLRKKWYSLVDEEPDVTIWQRYEWETAQEDNT